MGEIPRYTIFKTRWGYFGLAGTENALYRSCLPGLGSDEVTAYILSRIKASNAVTAKYDKGFFRPLQEKIAAYFEGACIEFDINMPVVLDGLSDFACSVLTTCRYIIFGQTISYSALASKLGRTHAARAVGNALAANPLPLIIPCHRVIRSDGTLGGFSAPGATDFKRKMLSLEQAALRN
jgi:methylated-DNA-[protein]-cysteine S-methyltransferase